MIAIGCDHAAVELKKEIIKALSEKGFEFKDMGTDGEPCDYPNMAEAVCGVVTSGECEKGILLCGTGIGMSLAANKFKGIRAAVCGDFFSAKYTRVHNDSNILCLGQRVKGEGLALELVDVFLNSEFEGGRLAIRLQKIADIENEQ